MVEEFDLLEEVEVQFCDEECTESVWHGVKYSESLFCREKPKSELTVVTTGESFRQLKRKMEQLGALSVAGVFLGKTVRNRL